MMEFQRLAAHAKVGKGIMRIGQVRKGESHVFLVCRYGLTALNKRPRPPKVKGRGEITYG